MRKGEMLSKIFGTALAILVIFSICGALPGIANVEPVSASPGFIYVPDNFTTIQQAVDNAISGDTIIVRDGTYHENVDVNKTLTIQSENGSANCVVSAANSNDHVFYVTADWVNITGFTVEGATGNNKAGIYLEGATAHCNISNNNASNNGNGIYLIHSNNNTLTSNTASNNTFYGIYLYSSSDNTLVSNSASNNEYGIYLLSSSNNSLSNNTANENTYDGINLWSSSNNTLTHNTASNNTVYGIYLYSSSSNTLTNNTVNSNTFDGICLIYSTNTTLTHNTVSNNDVDGIRLVSSSSNIIYNNYFNNTNNAWDNGANTWNTTKTPGTNIIGGPYLGGNYWSDYSGNDTNGDGLGDTLLPYNCTGYIQSGGDYLPLVGTTLVGHINFSGVAQGPEWVRGLNVSFFDNATQNETAWSPMNATTNSSGWFNVSGLDPGCYDVAIKNCTCLSEMVFGAVLTVGGSTYADFGTTREGDCNEDDWVQAKDRGLLYMGWGTTNVIQGGHLCDLNRDGWLQAKDRGLMYNNWGQGGDVLVYLS